MAQYRVITTTADQYKVVYDLSIGTIFNERSLMQISKSRLYSTLNISVMVEDRDIYNDRRIGTRMRFIEWCHFQLTLSDP